MNEELKKLLNRQREIIDCANAEERDLTAAETKEFNEIQNKIDKKRNEKATDNTMQGIETGADEGKSRELSQTDVNQIIKICRHFGADAAEFIERGSTLQQVREEIINRQLKNAAPLHTKISITDDERDKRLRAMADGIILRGGGAVENPADGSNNYRAMSLRDIAIECLEKENKNSNIDYRHMDNDRLISTLTRDFYNPESAFPSLLDNVVRKSYVEGLKKARVSFDKWVRFGALPNFKRTTNHEYIMSLGGKLERVPENGELKAYVPKDVAMPERQLDTYGRQFTMSRKAFVDDDIGLLTTMPRRYAEMSMKTQNEAVYDILMNNSKIYDGKMLFSAERKNTLAKGTDVTLSAIQKMIYTIGIQKDNAGNQLALIPDIFIVPFGLGVEVQKILGTPAFYSAEGTSINPYYGKGFEVIEDVALNRYISDGAAMPWFLGVKGEIIQVDYLNGQKEATIRRSEQPGILGFVWDVYFDFGVSMLHPQAICRNPGIVKSLGE